MDATSPTHAVAARTFTHRSLDADALAGALADLGFAATGPAEPVRTTLLDTVDGRLTAAGCELVHRAPGRGPAALVLAATHSLPASVPCPTLPRFVTDVPRGPLRARLSRVIDVRAVLPLVTVAGVERELIRRDRAGKTVASVRVTEQPVTTPASVTMPHLVVEVADHAGHDKHAERVAGRLAELGCQERAATLPAIAATAAGVDLRGMDLSPAVSLDPGAPARAGFVATLANLARAIDLTWQGTIDQTDPEFLHDLRVAVRRTRSVIGQGKSVLPDDVRDHYGAEFRWLGAMTGPARDLDVLLIDWPAATAELGIEDVSALDPVVEHLTEHRRIAHVALTEALTSSRADTLRAQWTVWLSEQASAAEHGGPSLGTVVSKRIRRAHRALVTHGREIDEHAAPERLHDLRKDAKKLRYAIECFGGALPGGPRKAFVKRLKAVQDNLGRFQDAEVHAGDLHRVAGELAREPGRAVALLALGQMAERLDRIKRTARHEFARQFEAYDSKDTEADLHDLVDGLRDR